MSCFNIDKEELLEKSEAFCLMPWIHMHIWPNGEAFPCCMARDNLPVGNVKNSTLLEVWNSDEFKQLRLNMLNNVKSPQCERCYVVEDSTNIWTLRKHANYQFENNFERIKETNEDGSLGKVHMAYLDIRWSNICNFKCRTCGPLLSSEWYSDHVKQYGEPNHKKVISVTEKESFWPEFKPHLLEVEEVYFAGGEALYHDEHYWILDYWLENSYNDVRIRYTTNFSNLKYKGIDILEYWKTFKDVRVAASLDDCHERAEYLRKGTNWQTIESNRRLMLKECPHVYFEITPTISAFNVFSFIDFHRDWVEKKLLEPNNVRVNILTHPASQSAQILPKHLKNELKTKYSEYKSWLKDNFKEDEINNTLQGLDSIIDFTFANDTQNLIPDFLNYNRRIDKLRDEDFSSVYPELKALEEHTNE